MQFPCTCRTHTHWTASVNCVHSLLYTGATAVCPVKSRESVTAGTDTDLRVYADADPPLETGEIIWIRPNGDNVINGSRFSLHESGKRLRMQSAGLEDSGTYRINIRRLIRPATYSILATTTIELDVIRK